MGCHHPVLNPPLTSSTGKKSRCKKSHLVLESRSLTLQLKVVEKWTSASVVHQGQDMGRLFRVHPFTWCGWVRWSWQGAGIKDHVMVLKRNCPKQIHLLVQVSRYLSTPCWWFSGTFVQFVLGNWNIYLSPCLQLGTNDQKVAAWCHWSQLSIVFVIDVIAGNLSDHNCQLREHVSSDTKARKWWLKLPQCSLFCFAERNPDISKMMNSLTQKLSEKRWLICQQNVALGRLKLSLTEVTANTVVQLYTVAVYYCFYSRP